MKLIKRTVQLVRLLNINIILLRNRVDTIVFTAPGLRSLYFISYFNPWRWFNKNNLARGESIRLAFEQLGPIFVKFGQILSTRRDLLPDDIADELEKLQDRVPSFPPELAKKIIEDAYKKPIEEVFLTFDLNPLASASIAQVHAATLPNGREVVVKILRPQIEKIIRRDISLLYSVAAFTDRFLPQGRQLRAPEVVRELERSITYELDLLHEAANASLLRRNFLNSKLLYVPEIFWNYSSHNVLVMERITGIPISDIATLKQQGVNLKKLAENGVEIFFTQVFRDSFFHADMHPGNIFVSKDAATKEKYIAVDFGIMGTLSPKDQRYLAENLLAFFKRDYRRVAQLHIESGWISNQVRIDEFETAIRSISEPIFERPFKDISFGNLLLKLFQVGRAFQMEIQPQFFLLQKTLVNIEGLGRQLYPELDLWTTAKPFLEKWVREQISPLKMLNKIYNHLPYWADKLLELPDLAHAALKQQIAEQQTNAINVSLLEKKTFRKKIRLGLGAGLLITVLTNYFLMHYATTQTSTINFIFALMGFIFIVFNLGHDP